MTKLKICGLTQQEDVSAAEKGAEAVGFIFYEKSPRYVSPEVVASIVTHPFTLRVGVFVNHDASFIREAVSKCRLDIIQLHGDENPEFCKSMPIKVIKAIRVKDASDLSQIDTYRGCVSAVLLDTKKDGMFGGTGQVFDWDLAMQAKGYGIPLILSGGLNADNVHEAIRVVSPYALDVSSGVELCPGKKDLQKLKEVISIVKKN